MRVYRAGKKYTVFGRNVTRDLLRLRGFKSLDLMWSRLKVPIKTRCVVSKLFSTIEQWGRYLAMIESLLRLYSVFNKPCPAPFLKKKKSPVNKFFPGESGKLRAL
jgi:hypothetical protein